MNRRRAGRPRSRRQARLAFATWLALAALGLLLFAPTFSRTLEAFSQEEAHAAHGLRRMEHSTHGDHASHAGSYEFAACGYCTLLYDNPALPWVVAGLPPLPPPRAERPSCRAPPAPELRPLDVCSRGPPTA